MSNLNQILTPEIENLIDERIKLGIIKYLDEIRLKRRIKIKEIIKLNHELAENYPLETELELLNLPYDFFCLQKDIRDEDRVILNNQKNVPELKIINSIFNIQDIMFTKNKYVEL